MDGLGCGRPFFVTVLYMKYPFRVVGKNARVAVGSQLV